MATARAGVGSAGFVPPIVTPFRDGRVDYDSLGRVLDDLLGNVQGILVGSSVGESPSLTMTERIELMRAVARQLDGNCGLAVSVSDNSILNTRELSDAAGEAGARTLLIAAPNYFSNDRSMLTAYFHAVSDFASADLCLYDNPIATHTQLTVADIKAIADAAPRVTAVKVTDTSIGKVEALMRETDLQVFAGDDVVLWNQMCGGVSGAMVAIPMIFPEISRALWSAYSAGDHANAERLFRKLSHFIQVGLGAPDYVPVIKTILHRRGVIASPDLRLPLVPLSPSRADQILLAYASDD